MTDNAHIIGLTEITDQIVGVIEYWEMKRLSFLFLFLKKKNTDRPKKKKIIHEKNILKTNN